MKEILWKGVRAAVLESDTVRLIVLPELGGKLASFYMTATGFETLFQAPDGIYRLPMPGDDFSRFDASGFDDAFPNIDAEEIRLGYKTISYPDHGEIWSMRMKCVPDLGETLRLEGRSGLLPFRYEKKVELSANTVRLEYCIENNGEEAFPCLWTMHCLLNCTPDMEIRFPSDVSEVLNVQPSAYLGKAGSLHQYPVTTAIDGSVYRLDRVLPRASGNTEKYYARGKVEEGSCGVRYPTEGVRLDIRYDAELLPYLGFWVTEGGFRGDYNCALEPSNGYYDSISIAKKNHALPVLVPGDAMRFWIELTLTQEGGD